MAKTKRKLLPKDFEAQLNRGDVEALKAVFDTCDVNARGGAFKQTTLAFNECPDELARWLVANGADILAGDHYADTPLHSRAGHWQGRLDILFELKADVNHGENLRGTPLHRAARSCNTKTANALIQHGARVNALNDEGETPLLLALRHCSNAQIEEMAQIAVILLEAGAQQSTDMQAMVTRIGTNFEFHRAGFNPEFLDTTSAALDKLYQLFSVLPVPKRMLYDGQSPIVASGSNLQDQYQSLWDLLVPSSGPASTVQGEVIRIAGRIHDELYRNGGTNWNADFRKMADTFLEQMGSGASLPDKVLIEVKNVIDEVKNRQGGSQRLSEFAVQWVGLNPNPLKLTPPSYNR
jgi:hypothetical protein